LDNFVPLRTENGLGSVGVMNAIEHRRKNDKRTDRSEWLGFGGN